MDDLRKVVKKTAPPAVVLQTLRTALSLPSPAAKAIIKDLTRPLGDQKRFIRKFNNDMWKGSLIMSEMIRCDDDIAIKRLQKSDIVIFEIHGGGFRVGSSTMYMDSFISWLRMFKKKYDLYACIMSVEYGLAPKHKYPAPLNECVKAYEYLVKDLGVSPSKIIFSGDSAGGALALETLIRTYSPTLLKDLDAPRENFDLALPAGVLLSSPLVSPETTSASWKKFAKSDMVTMGLADLIYKEYLDIPNVKMEDLPVSRIAHVRKDFDRFLPKEVLVFVGEKEVLRDDVVEMADAVNKDGKCNITVIQESYAHDWFLIHEIIKKKDKHLIEKYDEMFVDFAVEAVGKAKRDLLSTTPAVVSDISEKVVETTGIKKTPIHDLLDEQLHISYGSIKTVTDDSVVTTKISDSLDFNRKKKTPLETPNYKPNTILSEYVVVSD